MTNRKIPRVHILLALLGACGCCMPTLAQTQTLYAIGNGLGDGSSDLVVITDYAGTPVSASIGETGIGFLDLAVHPFSGIAYGVANDGLYRISLDDASTEKVGSLGGLTGFNALDFDRMGQAWGWRHNSDNLYRIDVDTGSATLVGGGSGYRSAGDLAFDIDGTLFGAAQGGVLVQFDTSTGQATLVGSLGISGPYGLEIDARGEMYVVDASDRNDGDADKVVLYSVDKTSGATTLIADLTSDGPFGNYGLAFGPPCGADFNGDGGVNTLDVLAYLNAWSSGDQRADFNEDGTINTLDVLAFLNAWATGC